MNTVNQVLEEFAASGAKIRLRKMRNEEDGYSQDYLLIEGEPSALRSFAKFVLAFADSDSSCTWDLHPTSAGSALFSEDSSIGIFLHKLPCDLHLENSIQGE